MTASDRPSDRPSEVVRARLMAAASREAATPPDTWRRRLVIHGVLAAAWMIGVTSVLGARADWSQLPRDLVIPTLVGLLGSAMLASVGGASRGRIMVGASSEVLFGLLASIPVLLLVVVTMFDLQGPETPLFADPGATFAGAVKCDLLIIGVGFPLLGLGWALLRGLILARPALSGACIGLGAATWAHAILRVHCPMGGPSHAIIGHLLPAIPLMALGAWVFSARSYVDRPTQADRADR